MSPFDLPYPLAFEPEKSSRPYQAIVIANLIVPCTIGIHAHEKKPQRLRISMRLELAAQTEFSDKISETLDYAIVLERVKALCLENRFLLLETLADHICTTFLHENKVQAVTIRIEKLDIFSDVEGIGIEMHRPNPS